MFTQNIFALTTLILQTYVQASNRLYCSVIRIKKSTEAKWFVASMPFN